MVVKDVCPQKNRSNPIISLEALTETRRIHFALIPKFASKSSNSTFQQEMKSAWDQSRARVLVCTWRMRTTVSPGQWLRCYLPLGSFRFEDEDEDEDEDEALCFRHNEIFKLFRLQLGRDDEVDCNNIVTPSLSRIWACAQWARVGLGSRFRRRLQI